MTMHPYDENFRSPFLEVDYDRQKIALCERRIEDMQRTIDLLVQSVAMLLHTVNTQNDKENGK